MVYRIARSVAGPYVSFAFHLQNCTFQSGAEWTRTPGLRRAKSGLRYRGRSVLFKIACKIEYLPLGAFVSVRRCSRGLVYYWCKRVLACCATGRSPVAIVPRSRWATCHHEPRRVQHPRARGDGHTRVAREVLDWHRAHRRPDLGLGLRAVHPQRPLCEPQGSVRSANAEQGGTLATSPYVGLSRIQAVMRCRLVVNRGSVVVHSPEAHKTGGRAVRRRRHVHESGGP